MRGRARKTRLSLSLHAPRRISGCFFFRAPFRRSTAAKSGVFHPATHISAFSMPNMGSWGAGRGQLGGACHPHRVPKKERERRRSASTRRVKEI